MQTWANSTVCASRPMWRYWTRKMFASGVKRYAIAIFGSLQSLRFGYDAMKDVKLSLLASYVLKHVEAM